MVRLRLRSRRAVAAVAFLGLAVDFVSAASNNATCYFPDGTVSPADFPCSDAATTHCCNDQNACLSTGYCLSAEQAPYVISRGSCTDSAWGTGCPAKCAGTNDDPGGGMPISWIGSNDDGESIYCCGAPVVTDGNVTCANSESSFTLGTSELLFGVAILANTTNTTAAASTSSSSSATSSSPKSSGSASCSTSDSDTSGSSSGSSSSSKTTAVGAGVGVSLGVVAAAAFSWALWERRKRQQQLKAFMSGGGAAYTDGPGSNPGGSGSPFSPGMASTAAASVSPSAAGAYAGSGKPYADPQQPLVELSAYPRHMEELPANP